MKKWGIVITILVLIAGLYFIEFSKINSSNETANAMPTLDNLQFENETKFWEEFYKVRATIIDGQRAEFQIPVGLKNAEGKTMELKGAAVFFSPGCTQIGDKIAVHSFFLYPTLGLANACVHLPEVAMRWTVRINLKNDWVLSRTEMIDAGAKVSGTFRIDTSKPYESAFFIDNATVELINAEEDQF